MTLSGFFSNTVLFAVAALLSTSLLAAEPVSKSRLGGVAIGGHDSVAYHELQRAPQDKAKKGAKTYTVEYKGAKWRFLSKESSELFAANPEKYSKKFVIQRHLIDILDTLQGFKPCCFFGNL